MTTRPPINDLITASRDRLGIPENPDADAAVALVALAHATRDASTWGGLTYWDQLVGRCLLATYRADTLPGWWEVITRALSCSQPTKAEDRDLLARTLAHPHPDKVLDLLATTTEALALRVRLAWEHHFGARKAAGRPEQETLV